MVKAAVDSIVQTLFQSEVQANPYPLYAKFRETDPVCWDAASQIWFLTRYSDIKAVATDSRFSSNRIFDNVDSLPQDARPLAEDYRRRAGQLLLFLDQPEHTPHRSMIMRGFTPAIIERLRERTEESVAAMIAQVRSAGQMDVVAQIAYPLPAAIICDFLDIPDADRSRFVAWSVDVGVTLSVDPSRPERTANALPGERGLFDYVHELVQARRRDPHDDAISGMPAASEKRRIGTIDTLAMNVAGLLFAGHETTANLIGNGMLALLRHPDQLERLREDESLIESTVEELLRYDAPVQGIGRRAREDVEVGGRMVAQGQYCYLALGAANRDPEQFSDPDRLDLARRDNHHLSFYHGPHFCVGAALARLEAQIAIGALARLPNVRLATENLRWRPNAL